METQNKAEMDDTLSKRDLALSVLEVADTDKKEDVQLKLTFQLHALLPDKTFKRPGQDLHPRQGEQGGSSPDR